MYRLLPLLFIISLFGLLALNFQTIKTEVAYRFSISGDKTAGCCDPKEIANSKGEFDEDASVAVFNGDIVDYPKTSLAQKQTENLAQANDQETDVLGTTNAAGEEKWIEVSLDEQKLRAWEGNRVIMEFAISSGRWSPTPKGDFNIWYKTRNQTMKGGSKELGTYYNLPNVPYNMFFYGGYAVHGAYWHNNFGHPMSHGCVNSPIANAGELFAWTGPVVPEGQNYVKASPENPGTRVFVH